MTTPRFGSAAPKVYVVSLVRARERRKAISQQLSRYGIDFVFVDAVDARQVEPEYLRSQVDEIAVLRNFRRPLTGPEVGCALSHRLVYRDIVEGQYYGGLVLEDDAIVTSHFPEVLAYFGQFGRSLSENWAVYQLEALSRSNANVLVLRKRTAVRVGRNVHFSERIGWLSSEAWGTCGYYITRKAAEMILHVARVETVADHWSLWAQRAGGRIFVSEPPTIIHPPISDGGEMQESRRASMMANKSTNGLICWLRELYYKIRTRLALRTLVVRWLVRPIAERFL